MFKTLAFTVAAGAISALVAVDAGALTLSPSQPAIDNGVTLVAGGCGPGWHREWGRCVRTRAVIVAPPMVAPMVCGPGRRWHHRRRVCVIL